MTQPELIYLAQEGCNAEEIAFVTGICASVIDSAIRHHLLAIGREAREALAPAPAPRVGPCPQTVRNRARAAAMRERLQQLCLTCPTTFEAPKP